MTFCLSRMWTDFPDCQGRLEYAEENDPSERYPGYGRECADDWINSGMSEFDSRLFAAINDMLLDMLAAVARRDYEQRRERQKQGIEKARKDGKYKGRKPNQARHDAIIRLIESGSSRTQVQKVLGAAAAQSVAQ